MAIQVTVGDVKHIQMKYWDGAPDAAGNATGKQVNTPAQTAYAISDPTMLDIAPTSADIATWTFRKVGSVNVEVSVPAATDDTTDYSAFTGSVTATVSRIVVTILSFEVVVG